MQAKLPQLSNMSYAETLNNELILKMSLKGVSLSNGPNNLSLLLMHNKRVWIWVKERKFPRTLILRALQSNDCTDIQGGPS